MADPNASVTFNNYPPAPSAEPSTPAPNAATVTQPSTAAMPDPNPAQGAAGPNAPQPGGAPGAQVTVPYAIRQIFVTFTLGSGDTIKFTSNRIAAHVQV